MAAVLWGNEPGSGRAHPFYIDFNRHIYTRNVTEVPPDVLINAPVDPHGCKTFFRVLNRGKRGADDLFLARPEQPARPHARPRARLPPPFRPRSSAQFPRARRPAQTVVSTRAALKAFLRRLKACLADPKLKALFGPDAFGCGFISGAALELMYRTIGDSDDGSNNDPLDALVTPNRRIRGKLTVCNYFKGEETDEEPDEEGEGADQQPPPVDDAPADAEPPANAEPPVIMLPPAAAEEHAASEPASEPTPEPTDFMLDVVDRIIDILETPAAPKPPTVGPPAAKPPVAEPPAAEPAAAKSPAPAPCRPVAKKAISRACGSAEKKRRQAPGGKAQAEARPKKKARLVYVVKVPANPAAAANQAATFASSSLAAAEEAVMKAISAQDLAEEALALAKQASAAALFALKQARGQQH